MRIANKTKKTIIATNYRLCKSISSKARGLMFTSKNEVLRNSLLFEFGGEQQQSLHMFFVFYPIDLVFADGKKRVVDVKERFRPFTVYNSHEKSQYVIELPVNAIKKSKTKKGDVLEW